MKHFKGKKGITLIVLIITILIIVIITGVTIGIFNSIGEDDTWENVVGKEKNTVEEVWNIIDSPNNPNPNEVTVNYYVGETLIGTSTFTVKKLEHLTHIGEMTTIPVGYRLKGWSDDINSTQIKYLDEQAVTMQKSGTLNLYAVWQTASVTINLWGDGPDFCQMIEDATFEELAISLYSDGACQNLKYTIPIEENCEQYEILPGTYYIRFNDSTPPGYEVNNSVYERSASLAEFNTEWNLPLYTGWQLPTNGYVFQFKYIDSTTNEEIDFEKTLKNIDNIYIDIYSDQACTTLVTSIGGSTRPAVTLYSNYYYYCKVDGAPLGYAANNNIYSINNDRMLISFTPGETPVLDRTPTPTPTLTPGPTATPSPTPSPTPEPTQGPPLPPTPTPTIAPPSTPGVTPPSAPPG